MQARADWSTNTIEVPYDTMPDPCACICTLDAAYVLEGIPAGTWTVDAVGATDQVVVP